MRLPCPAAGIDYTMLMLMLVISAGGISCLYRKPNMPHRQYTLSIIDYILQIEHTLHLHLHHLTQKAELQLHIYSKDLHIGY